MLNLEKNVSSPVAAQQPSEWSILLVRGVPDEACKPLVGAVRVLMRRSEATLAEVAVGRGLWMACSRHDELAGTRRINWKDPAGHTYDDACTVCASLC